MLTISKLSKTKGVKTILFEVSFSLGDGAKVTLVGPNGIGKSTLLKIVAGEEQSDGGEIVFSKGLRVAYLPQEINLTQETSVGEYVLDASGIKAIESRMRQLESDLENPANMTEYCELQSSYGWLGGDAIESKIKKILSGFGLPTNLDCPLQSLSGGQKAKAALTAVLLKEADIMLLDEPTNNLDLPAIIWLEAYLK